MTPSEVRVLIDDVAEELALILGGLVTLHPASDELVEQILGSLLTVRNKALRRVTGPEVKPAPSHLSRRIPRPSIGRFLEQIGRGR